MKGFNLIYAIILFLFSTNVAFSDIYEVTPDVATCNPGALTAAEKTKVLNFINKIRAHHKLAPVEWATDKENISQGASLSMLATGQMSHDPVSGKCSDAISDKGRKTSNLMMGSSTSSALGASEKDIIGWLIDANSLSGASVVGHRRLIINPFLKRTCYGRADGNHPTKSGWYMSTANLYGIDSEAMQASTCENDFVAYPYQNYPIDWVDKSFYLSFTPIADENFWAGGFNKVNFTNTIITMKTESGNNIQVSDIAFDYDAWGSFVNNISWKAKNLQDETKYLVTISNVIVNGATRDYEYWFKLTNDETEEPTIPIPEPPVLSAPINNITNVDASAPIIFSWNASEHAKKYKIEISLSSDFLYIFFEKETTDLFVEVNTLTPDNKFYWRVAAYNEEDKMSSYSDVWNLTTKEEIPDAPELISPTPGATDVSSMPKFTWQEVQGAKYYQLQVSTAQNFAVENIKIDQDLITSTSYELTEQQELAGNTNYFWRVRAIMPSDNSTLWSSSKSFRTGTSSIEHTLSLDGVYIYNYPNPFSESTNIFITSEKEQYIMLDITDHYGRIVKNIFSGFITAGENNFNFKVDNLASGSYYCRIFMGDKIKIYPISIIK